MTPRERVLTAMDHREPDRVPLWYGASEGLTARLQALVGAPDEEALLRRLGIDFRRLRPTYAGPESTRQGLWDVRRAGSYYGQPRSHPLADALTVEAVDAFAWPSPDWLSFDGLAEQADAWGDYAVIGGPWVVVFTDATELVGMADFLERMYTHPEVIHAVLQHVSDYYHEVAVRFFEALGDRCDLFFFGDDFGTQEALLISLSHWREFCLPHLRRFTELGHQAGLRVMFHSCGAIRSLLPDLCALGVDALNPVQVTARGMDPLSLKAEFGDRLTFHGGVDHQHVLPFGTTGEVRDEVRRMIDVLGPGGGYCLAASHDLLLDEFPPENVLAMYDEAAAYGRYQEPS